MKKIYKYLCVIVLCGGSLAAIAQRTNEEMSREVIMLREYNPTLSDAEKINIEPTILPVKKKELETKFLTQAPVLSGTSSKIAYVASGDSNTAIQYDEQLGYLGFGAGSYGNMEGRAGVQLYTSESNTIDFWGKYQATSGNVKFIEYKNIQLLKDKNKAKFSDLDLHLAYKHLFTSSTLKLGIDFQDLAYNYYGSPFDNYTAYYGYGGYINIAENAWQGIDFDSKQHISLIKVKAQLFSNIGNQSKFAYDSHLAYTAFSSKYGYMPKIDKGPRGGILDADLNLFTRVMDLDAGIRGDLTYQNFGSKKDYSLDDTLFGNYFNIQVRPYVKMEDTDWNVDLGLNLNYVRSNGKNKMLLSPNVKANLYINDVNILYFNALGGVNNNTFVDVINENRYVDMVNNVEYSKTPFDIQLGYKSGVIPALEFDIFGGYKQIKNAHYFMSQIGLYDNNLGPKYWGNVGTPLYYKTLNVGHIGAQLNTKLIPMTSLTLRGTGYFYSAKDEKTIFGRPNFELSLSADIKPIDPLNINLTYLLQTGRKGCYWAYEIGDTNRFIDELKMNNINELDVSIEYQIIKLLSVYAKVNNLLNQKYELQPGYTLQGINVVGGFNLKF